MIDKDRRAFFKKLSLTNKATSYIRPPYNTDKELFYSLCPYCEDKPCIASCPKSIIKIDDKTPYLDFSSGGCTFCMDCATACPEDVLLPLNKASIFARTTISKEKCLAFNKTICSSCLDICYYNAISFTGLFNPSVSDTCTNCGFCLPVCPTKAITITALA